MAPIWKLSGSPLSMYVAPSERWKDFLVMWCFAHQAFKGQVTLYAATDILPRRKMFVIARTHRKKLFPMCPVNTATQLSAALKCRHSTFYCSAPAWITMQCWAAHRATPLHCCEWSVQNKIGTVRCDELCTTRPPSQPTRQIADSFRLLFDLAEGQCELALKAFIDSFRLVLMTSA